MVDARLAAALAAVSGSSPTPRWSVGLMTGTALDGDVDVALLRTDGKSVLELGPWALVPYASSVRTLIEDAVAAARAWAFDGPEPDALAVAEDALSAAQGEAVLSVLDAHGIDPRDVAAIGFHGQTVLHRAPAAGVPGRTRQLGDGAAMARATGIDVVSDFRSNDVRRGGQGAPLAAVYHRALLVRADAPPGTVFVNLGGVANLTCVVPGRTADDDLIAFDTGPANGPVDDWVRRWTGEPMDRDGRLARAGRVDEDRLVAWMAHPYFAAPWPKSLDRFDFGAGLADGLGLEDGAATLTAFAAAALASALALLPIRARSLVVAGGGRRNPALMDELRARTRLPVHDADALGLRGDAIEAECFAFLAERGRRALPISFPSTTGAPRPLTGGTLDRAPRRSPA